MRALVWVTRPPSCCHPTPYLSDGISLCPSTAMLFTSRPPLHTLSPTPTPLHTSTPINHSPCVNSVLGLVRLLGELYNYSVVSAAVIYEFLYTAINYGHRGGPAPDTPSSSASASSASAAAPAPAAGNGSVGGGGGGGDGEHLGAGAAVLQPARAVRNGPSQRPLSRPGWRHAPEPLLSWPLSSPLSRPLSSPLCSLGWRHAPEPSLSKPLLCSPLCWPYLGPI